MFKLKENNTTVSREVLAGFTTFFAMIYIIAVNPSILSLSGMPWGGVFLATILATVVGTLTMGLFANVPYAVAPGMGLNAFFTFTVVMAFGFTWQQALSMVFICGLINVLITVTKLRKSIVKAIPPSLQNAIGGGIGIFIAYIGLVNIKFVGFANDIPSLAAFNTPSMWLFLIGILLTIALLVLKVKGAIVIGIVATALLGIPFGITSFAQATSFNQALSELPVVFGAIFTEAGIPSLFNDMSKLPLVLTTIFAFSITDTFDTIGTFIGTGRVSGIFSAEDERQLEEGSGLSSKMDKALYADAVATSMGAIFGTSNTTTYVESAAGIGAGGRTGLTSVVVAGLFLLSAFFSNIVSAIPSVATAPALVIVGIMMMSAFKEINWHELEDAIPAFFASVMMGFTYSISHGIAFGFITYVIIKILRGKAREIHPIVWGSTILFIINFVLLALIA